MKPALYVCAVTEYEAGWGARPDGYLAAIGREALDRKILAISAGGSYECFNRCETARVAFVTQEFYDKVAATEEQALWTSTNNWLIDT